ncbi:glucokinase [Ectopseudomonas mendocina]|nr:glucokinase [Pseudomonas mendocina]
MKPSLVGDIGGTNARFALWRDERLEAVRVLVTADFADPQLAIAHYLAEQCLAPGDIAALCLAVAGPVKGEHFRFTNNHWQFARSELAAFLRLQPADLLVINDFTAMALGMTRLRPQERLEICPGVVEEDCPAVVIGPGTGLGVGTLLPLGGGHWRALPGEGGHVDLPIATPREAQLWQALHAQLGHVRAEDVLSGSGLLRLYRALCTVDGHSALLSSPAQVTAAALAGDALASSVLEQFCVWLGRAAGNCVLTLGARGGVYIVGGVVPRFADFFRSSGFARGFAEKGSMSRYLDGVPVWLVTAEYPGLEGAGVALQERT